MVNLTLTNSVNFSFFVFITFISCSISKEQIDVFPFNTLVVFRENVLPVGLKRKAHRLHVTSRSSLSGPHYKCALPEPSFPQCHFCVASLHHCVGPLLSLSRSGGLAEAALRKRLPHFSMSRIWSRFAFFSSVVAADEYQLENKMLIPGRHLPYDATSSSNRTLTGSKKLTKMHVCLYVVQLAWL